MKEQKETLLLCILDGYGLAPQSEANAIKNDNIPNITYLTTNFPFMELHASGEWVGLPAGQMGNSEVGHINMGAGRTIFQSLTLINKAVREKTLFQNQVILEAIAHAKQNNSALHIMGLLSNGGVHAHIDHILALLDICQQENFTNVLLHPILDGRDTKYDLAKTFLEQLLGYCAHLGFGQIASLSGRYYAMDRDKRWERTKQAYDVQTNHVGKTFTDALSYIDENYAQAIYDEFIVPAYNETIDGRIKENDSVIFANFRPDRAIQLAATYTNADYACNLTFDIPILQNLYFATMMFYADSVKTGHLIFPPQKIINGLGSWLSQQGKTQLRIAETEKYAHVTYFFDGGTDIEYPFEERLLIPSPKVATYNLKPEMSAEPVTDAVVAAVASQKFDVIILNFANPDMVGHTGDLAATIEAIKVIDVCVGRIYHAIAAINGIFVLTADHGNCEVMLDADHKMNKTHTSQKVPFIVTKKGLKLVAEGSLTNIAPTILELMKLKIPEEMTSTSLIA